MVSEATLDVPSATTIPDAEPQQGASTAHTTPAPTAASDMLPEPSYGSPDSYSTATKTANDQHGGYPISPASMVPSTPDLSAGTQSDALSGSAGSPMPNDAESGASSDTGGTVSPVANNAGTSASHTAMMESQTPDLVSGSQGDASSTTASGSLANDASTGTQSENASALPSGTSAGISIVSNVWSYTALTLLLLLSYLI